MTVRGQRRVVARGRGAAVRRQTFGGRTLGPTGPPGAPGAAPFRSPRVAPAIRRLPSLVSGSEPGSPPGLLEAGVLFLSFSPGDCLGLILRFPLTLRSLLRCRRSPTRVQEARGQRRGRRAAWVRGGRSRRGQVRCPRRAGAAVCPPPGFTRALEPCHGGSGAGRDAGPASPPQWVSAQPPAGFLCPAPRRPPRTGPECPWWPLGVRQWSHAWELPELPVGFGAAGVTVISRALSPT